MLGLFDIRDSHERRQITPQMSEKRAVSIKC